MQSLLAVALALLPQEAARTKPVPPPVGSGAHVTSSLISTLAIQFTADGKVLRKFEQSVEEPKSEVTIEVVADVSDGLPKDAKGNVVAVDPPPSHPPYVRLRYGECLVKRSGPGATDKVHSSDEFSSEESNQIFFFERGAESPDLRRYLGTFSPDDAPLQARVRADADAFLVGPRLAPVVLGRELAVGAKLDVEADAVAAIVALAVADGTAGKAQLTYRGPSKDGATELLDFGIALAIHWKGGDELPVTATFDLAGDLRLVKATAQLFEFKLAGPIRYGGTSDENGAKLEITGTGNLTCTYRADPLAAK